MKKRMSKVLSGLIILTMIISSTGLAFADETNTRDISMASPKATELKDKVIDALQSQISNSKMSAKSATQGNNISIPTWKTGSESEMNALIEKYSSWINYNRTDDSISGNSCGYVQKQYISKGTVVLSALAVGDGEEFLACSNVGIFNDAAMTRPVGGKVIEEYEDDGSLEDQDVGIALYTIPESRYYYVGAYSNNSDDDAQNYAVFISALRMSGLDRTVYSGSQIAVGQTKAQTNYFKFTATKTGYIRVNLTDIKGKIKLCNYNKSKSLSNTSSATQSIVYGVKKGSTYYIKVSAPVNEDIGGYTFKVTNYGITENSGSTQSKAKTIYRGLSKAKNGNIIAGYSTSDWYKFTLSSSKAVNIVMKGATNNGIKIAVYKGSKLIKSTTFGRTNESVMIKSIGKWTKGTYYIKISRANSYSSGYYKCYWYYR